MSDIPFLGTGWSFPPTFDKDGATVEMLSDENDIRSSLEILLSTSVGERIMQPRYGCNLKNFLFEPLNTTMKAYIKDLVKKAILYFEPRVKLEEISLVADDNNGMLVITVEYTVRTTNTRNNLVFPFYIQEGTNVSK
jgi:phage baseplate assembly protein W